MSEHGFEGKLLPWLWGSKVNTHLHCFLASWHFSFSIMGEGVFRVRGDMATILLLAPSPDNPRGHALCPCSAVRVDLCLGRREGGQDGGILEAGSPEGLDSSPVLSVSALPPLVPRMTCLTLWVCLFYTSVQTSRA